jgi:2-polyprenyl-6-methoxyphenol hydroxylase-like FAD-dependent oxidoreductase
MILMPKAATRSIPVLVAGGGPVGMTVALFLAHYGVPTILVERNPSTTRHPKMDLTNGRTMELFRRIGIVDKLRDVGVPRDNPFDISWITSFAGHELHRFRYPSSNQAAEIAARVNDGSFTSEAPLRVSQVVIEPALKAAIDAHPLIDVRFNTTFERIVKNDEAGVVVEVHANGADETYEIECQYLAGCDGGGSRVRRQLGIELDGNMAVAGAYMVHFRSDARDLMQRWGIAWHYQNGGGSLIAQNDQDIWTLQRWLIPGEDPDQLKAEDILETWAGCKFDYEILQANPWAANLVVAERYVDNRVALAGDSAHQYIPTGGYGMNSGIADAAALSWALAALVQGWGGDKLLAAYEAERKPTAWWHLEAAQRHMAVRIAFSELYAAAGDLEGDSPEAAARRSAAAEQVVKLGNAENESWGVEQGYRYDGSPIIAHEAGAPTIDPLTYRPNTWPGVRLPHVFLEPGLSIHDKLGRYFTLIALTPTNTAAVRQAAEAADIPVEIVELNRPDLLPIYERPLLLVRPDQHIAWRGDRLPDDVNGLLSLAAGR